MWPWNAAPRASWRSASTVICTWGTFRRSRRYAQISHVRRLETDETDEIGVGRLQHSDQETLSPARSVAETLVRW